MTRPINLEDYLTDPLSAYSSRPCTSPSDYATLFALNREMDLVRSEFRFKGNESARLAKDMVLSCSTLYL